VGATVFELGYPDRKADKFRHGEDYWVPEPSPKLGYVTPIWGGEREFVLDNPNGLTYAVGQNQWPRDWSYIIPAPPDATGRYQPGTGTITFNLPTAPTGDAKASLYLACAGDESGGVIVSINGTNLGSAPGVTAAPNPMTEAGFDPPATYDDDSAEHYSDHGPFFDQRINFPGSLLHAGANTLSIQVAGKKGMPYLMLDYLRLELTGYVPPAPASVSALAGNGRNLVTWPVVAGATSYNILRSSTSGSGYASLASDVTAPVAGSGPSLASYADGERHGLFLRRPIGQSHRHQSLVDAEPGRHSAGDDFHKSARDTRWPQDRQLRPSSRFAELDGLARRGQLSGLALDAAPGRPRRRLPAAHHRAR
jgi:hypothetical protein